MKNKISSLSNALKDGFFLILPFGVTIWLIYYAWNFLREIIPDLSKILPAYWLENPYLYNIIDLIFFLIVIVLIIFFGMIASTFLGKMFNFLIEKILMSQTFIKPIYRTFKKMAEMFFHNDEVNPINQGLSESILIPYPNKNTYAIGFITANNANHLFGDEEGPKWLTVYMPSAPLVSAGFYLICKKEDTKPCLLSSGKAMTTIISVGSVQSENISFENIAHPVKKTNPLKVWFFNGLLFLTPLLSTLAILNWAFNYLYKFILGVVHFIPPILINVIPSQYYTLILSISLIIILTIVILIIGFIGESAFGTWIKSLSERIFNSIPMFNTVYNIVQQIVRAFSPDPSKNKTFNQAVLVPFPTESTYAIGFVTGTNSSAIKKEEPEKRTNYIPIFLPTTPIPTTGWFVLIPEEQLIPLHMPIEEAFGLVISGGILTETKDKEL